MNLVAKGANHAKDAKILWSGTHDTRASNLQILATLACLATLATQKLRAPS